MLLASGIRLRTSRLQPFLRAVPRDGCRRTRSWWDAGTPRTAPRRLRFGVGRGHRHGHKAPTASPVTTSGTLVCPTDISGAGGLRDGAGSPHAPLRTPRSPPQPEPPQLLAAIRGSAPGGGFCTELINDTSGVTAGGQEFPSCAFGEGLAMIFFFNYDDFVFFNSSSEKEEFWPSPSRHRRALPSHEAGTWLSNPTSLPSPSPAIPNINTPKSPFPAIQGALPMAARTGIKIV